MKSFENRVAVVTGAGSGIGRAVAQGLAARGCDLALVDVDEKGLGGTAEVVRRSGRRASTHRVDVSDREAMRALPDQVLAEHGHVHILVNNAGVNAAGTFEEISLENFEWVLGVNLWGVIYGTRFFLPHLKGEDEAHIVNVSSLFGLVGMPESAAYCASKFAVRGFSESLWAELADTNVGVTSVHPGGVATNIVRTQRLADEAEREERAEEFARVARTSPERAAERIIGAIRKNKLRQRICVETYVVDWIKRLLPTGIHWGIVRGASGAVSDEDAAFSRIPG